MAVVQVQRESVHKAAEWITTHASSKARSIFCRQQGFVFPLGTLKTVDKSHKTAVYKDLSGLKPGIGLCNL